MSILPWVRRMCGRDRVVCHDILTRLDSRELADLQDAGRNGIMAVKAELVKAAQSLGKMSRKLDEMERRMQAPGIGE